MKTMRAVLIGAAITVLPLYAQQVPSVKRHPNEHLHYNVTLIGGEIDKVVHVSMNLNTKSEEAPNQAGSQPQFGGQCQKTNDPKIWFCDLVIPQNIRPGDYMVYSVGVSTNDFGKGYEEDFHAPIVPIENSITFTPPSKVTVTPQP